MSNVNVQLYVQYVPQSFRQFYTNTVSSSGNPEETFDIIITLPAIDDVGNLFSIAVSDGTTTTYLDGLGGLTKTAVLKTLSDWNSELKLGYPKCSIYSYMPGVAGDGGGRNIDISCTIVTTQGGPPTYDTSYYTYICTVQLKKLEWESTELPVNHERINMRKRWEVRGELLDFSLDGLYKDLAQLLGVYNSSGVLSADGAITTLRDDLQTLQESTLDDSVTTSSYLNIATTMETLRELDGSPILKG